MKHVVAVVAVATVLLAIACGSKTSSADPELIRSATEFGGIVLPASAEVVEVYKSAEVVSAQDRYLNADGTWVYRNVLVNQREPDVRFVHLEMYPT